MGGYLAKFRLFASVSGTGDTSTKEIKYKQSSVGEPLAKFRLLSSVAPPLLDYLKRTRAKDEEKALKHGLLLSIVDCCEQGYIII